MEFITLLQYARQYKNELGTLDGLHDFLECINEFSEYEMDMLDILSQDLNIDESSEYIKNGDCWYYTDIYNYIDLYFYESGLYGDLPYWISIDYEKTFRNICCESCVAYTDMYSPFVVYC
jgi:hypothetical protein|nr:MAG TPA: hypothetical protein [Caudoviricetes sp.]